MVERHSRRDFIEKSSKAALGVGAIASGLGAEGCKSCEDKKEGEVDQQEFLQLAKKLQSLHENELDRAKNLEKYAEFDYQKVVPLLEKKLKSLNYIVLTLSTHRHTQDSLRKHAEEIKIMGNELRTLRDIIKELDEIKSGEVSDKPEVEAREEDPKISWESSRVKELGLDQEIEPVDPGEMLARYKGNKKGVGWETDFVFQNNRGDVVNIGMAKEKMYQGSTQENTKSLPAFKGDGVMIVTVGASWCMPCREELADLALLSKYMGDRENNLLFIMSEAGPGPDEHNTIIKNFQGSPDLLTRVRFYPDEGGTIKDEITELGLSKEGAVPVTVLLDKDGNIRHAVSGRKVEKDDIKKFRQYAAWLGRDG